MESIFRATLSQGAKTLDESITGAIPTKGDLMFINIDFADGHMKIFYDTESFDINYADMVEILGEYKNTNGPITEYELNRLSDGEILIFFNPLRNTLDDEIEVAKTVAKKIRGIKRY